MVNTIHRKIIKRISIAIAVGIFLSCGNTDAKIAETSIKDDGPIEVSEGVTMVFTDMGVAKIKLETPLLHRYAIKEDEETKLECPIGLVVTFYDSVGNVESILHAKYGLMYSKKEYILVKDSVVFENNKKEKLITDLLHVDFKKDSVYTTEKVTVESPKGTITGFGLNSNSSFTKYVVHNISNGIFDIEEEEVNLSK